MRTKKAWKTWGEAFNYYRRKGHPHPDAAVRADEWQARRQPTS